MDKPVNPMSRRSQHGASLLEVLITILIMSFGLLGIAGLTVSSLQSAKLAQFQSTALQLANDYSERIRGNISGAKDGAYNMTDAYDGVTTDVTVPGCATAGACTAAELASIDQAEWTNELRRRLPGGGAYVVRDGLAIDIWVMLLEPGLDFDGSSTLSVAGTGGSQCPAAALAGYAGEEPICMYYRVSI